MVSVSIIIPVYNIFFYIERCLYSVIKQKYKEIECLIIDDASEDDSIKKCQMIISEYKGPIKFRIIHHDFNRGLSAARNTGIDRATGDYIFFLDGDDEISDNAIELLMAPILKDDSIEMVQGRNRDIESNRTVLSRGEMPIRILSNDCARTFFFKKRLLRLSVWNKILKRSFVLDHNLYFKEGLLCEDHLWAFYLIKNVRDAFLSNEITYNYYCHRPHSITSDTKMSLIGENFAIIFNEILHNLTPGYEKKEINGYVERFCLIFLVYKGCTTSIENLFGDYFEASLKYKCGSSLVKLYFTKMIGKTKRGLGIVKGISNIKKRIVLGVA